MYKVNRPYGRGGGLYLDIERRERVRDFEC